MRDIRNDVGVFGISTSLENAMDHASRIRADQIRIVTLYADLGVGQQGAPIGFLVVPGGHKCPACSQEIFALPFPPRPS